jgi:hypothetical protein
MAPPASPLQRVELLGTVQVLHDHLTVSLCQTVFQQTHTTEREWQWSGLAQRPHQLRSIFRTLPDLALALLGHAL